MEKISVKAVKGRTAFTAARGGVKIPHDNYIEVDETEWIKRLRDFHGDIVQENKSAPKVVTAKPKEPKPSDTPADTK